MAESTTPVMCPRCGQMVGELVAWSRVSGVRDDDEAEPDICNPCGSDEALEAAIDGGIRPVSEWPSPRTFQDHDGTTIRGATGEIVGHSVYQRLRVDEIQDGES